MVEENRKKIQGELDDLKKKVITTTDLEDKLRAFSEKVKATSGSPKASSSAKIDPLSPESRMKVTVDHISKEMKEKAEKKNNIIVHNKEEQITNDVNERNALDKEELMNVIKDTLKVRINQEDIIKITRLGAKMSDKKRPILLCLKEYSTKEKIFANLPRLKPSIHNHLSFNHDMTLRERDEFKKLIEEAKRKEAESMGKIKYRVRGPPWNRKIVEMPVQIQEVETAATTEKRDG